MKKKTALSKLFLYRHRFVIGFIVLSLAYVGLLFGLPLLSPAGLSEAEMISATKSYNIHPDSIFHGDIVNLPYRVLQKLSILIFGFNMYSIKLPSIVIGLLLGGLLILLLNRWFKNNVALLASILAVLSASFLYLAGSGTPLIMLVFWPTLLLWLGSKIQGVTKPKPLYCFVFAFALLASIFTPHLIYLALFIILFAFLHPHLRFTIKNLPIFPLILTSCIILVGLAAMIMAAVINPSIIAELLLAPNLSLHTFLNNLQVAFLPFFSWNSPLESVFLAPFIGLGSITLAIIGLLSTAKGFFASRNSIASCLIVFTIILAGLNPESAILILLPMAILIAHGLRYILAKWYDLFPDNPYARVSALFPIGLFLSIMIVGGISHFIFGYRYIPMVADNFNNDLTLATKNLNKDDTLYIIDNEIAYQFFQIADDQKLFHVTNSFPIPEQLPKQFATLGLTQIPTLAIPTESISGTLLPPVIEEIITSPKSDNSDRMYIYTRNSINETTE